MAISERACFILLSFVVRGDDRSGLSTENSTTAHAKSEESAPVVTISNTRQPVRLGGPKRIKTAAKGYSANHMHTARIFLARDG